ncbi:MAG: arginase [Methylobacter sp.]|nr:arginase [Methylobacter sp.]
MIITVRYDTGARFRGSDQGVTALLDLSKKSGISANLDMRDCIISFDGGFTSVYARNIEKVLHICEAVCLEVCESVLSGHIPILISGDHSSATGTIAGIKKAKPESRLGIIWIDAHADLHSPFTSYSGHMHGMTLAASLGVDNIASVLRNPDQITLDFWHCFKHIGGMSEKIKPSDIVYVTLRDLEKQEAHLIDKYGIRNITTKELRDTEEADIGTLILEHLNDCTDIYLSFDTDSLDGAISKGTGLPVDNGILPKEAETLIGMILKDPKVICFEITELNPKLDINHATTNMVYQILEKAIAVLK